MEGERLLIILEYLTRNSNESRGVTIHDIGDHLAANYRLQDVSVITIRRDIDRLVSIGYDIRKENGAHNTAYYRLKGNRFSFNEIRFIVDSVSINKFLSARQKQQLIKKFEGMCSNAEIRQLISRIELNNIGAPSLDLLKNLDTIHRLISEKRSINFRYGKFDAHKQMKYYNKHREI